VAAQAFPPMPYWGRLPSKTNRWLGVDQDRGPSALGRNRRACGYVLANRGHDARALQDYLGHRNIQHTVRYSELSPTRVKSLFGD
jgi:integrase